jgi:hypothetical protein
MSTIKISQLPLVTTFTANTQNTVFVGVDLDADLTGQFTAQSIARNLFLNETLIVGNNIVQFANVIGQFSGSSPTYLQINNQNFNANGSADYVASTSDSDNSFGFIDMGIEGASYNGVVAGYPAFKPYDGYLYMVGKSVNSPTGNLIIGTQNASNTVFINGGVGTNNIVALMTANGLVLNTQSYITFADNTRQITSAASLDYTTKASAVANNASANSIVLQAGLNAANANIAIALAGVAAANANISGGVAAVNANIAFLNAVNLTQNDNIQTATTLSQYALGVQATQNTRIQTAQNQANVAGIVANTTAVVANTAVQNTALIIVNSLSLTGNLIANGLNQTASIDNIVSNNLTLNKNLTVFGSITANTILGNVFFSNITTVYTQANAIQWFAQGISPVQQNGQVWYSANTISLTQDTDIPGDRPAISKVLFERVYNNTGSAIPNSSWVRLAGGVTSNSVPYIQLADASSAANSQVEGFVKVGIAAGGYGFVYTRGIVSDFDASTFGNNGQLLFLSTTPGQATNAAPTGANSVVSVAKILSNGTANGKLQVGIQSLQAYGKTNGAILFANNNLIQASNTLFINEPAGRLNVSSSIYAANGIINKTSEFPSTQTAITINMTTDSWVKCNVGASLAITPTAFSPGTEVIVIVTNPNTGGGANRTITHGGIAYNSSVGATSFVLGGTTTAFIKYYSLDGDLANTYVQVTYS